MLVNPAGVVFSQGAQVNAASVIVSTADVANKNLAAGKLIFDQPGKPGAMVVNNGNITVKSTGLAALVAPGVANAGTISAPFGRVALAGGEASVVDLYGDGLMSIDVTKQVTTVPNGPDGKPVAALVTNTGVIKATGGRIELVRPSGGRDRHEPGGRGWEDRGRHRAERAHRHGGDQRHRRFAVDRG